MWRPEMMLAHPVLQRWSYLASEVVPYQYATQLKVPTVFVNQGGITHTPIPVPRFWPLSPLSNFGVDFCGKSCVRDASGKILTRANATDIEFCSVVSADVQPVVVPPDTARVDISPRYLNADYYFVQPPFLAKTLQAWSFREFQGEYETRRKRYAA
jgi:hypothetical protein